MPDAATLQVLSFALQVVNLLLLPAVIGLGRFLLRVDKRLLVMEIHMGLHGKRAADS